jgi:hypothetical protein
MMLNADDYLKKLQGENAKLLGPFFDKEEIRFRGGDKQALLSTVVLCLYLEQPVPRWARDALWDVYNNRPKSWDDAFGPPLPKGKSASAAHRHREIASGIVVDVGRAKAPIDDDLFKRVGKKYKVSGATAKRIYYGDKYRNVTLGAHAFAKKMFMESAASGTDAATWLQQHEGELASFVSDFQENSKRLRNSRSADKQRTSHKPVKD